MGRVTAIGWTTSTFNSHIGCTEVSLGCDHCYARELDKRYRWGGATHWGAGVPRMRTSTANWRQPVLWNRKQGQLMEAWRDGGQIDPPVPWRVFCSSLADFADNEVPPEWQRDLEALIAETPYLDWLLVTKRIGNVAKLYPAWARDGFPGNVRVIASVVNQEEADRDIPKLLRLPCKNGISYEPALGPIKWRDEWLYIGCAQHADHGFLHWIIVGGESHQGVHRARPFYLEWARATVSQGRAAGVPVFVKQLGAHPHEVAFPGNVTDAEAHRWMADGWTRIWADGASHWRRYHRLKDRAGADPAEWPTDLQVQEFPK